MQIEIEWQQPIRLTQSKRLIFNDQSIPPEITSVAGVYYFSRRYGSAYTPFYIGESLDLRERLKNHLKSVAIVDVLRGHFDADRTIAQGARYFHFGFFIGKQKQDAKKCIKIVERALIKQAVEYNLPILNKSLTKIKTHSISLNGSSNGRGWFDQSYSVEA